LATETESNHCLGIKDDAPLEDARLISSTLTKLKQKPSPDKAPSRKSETMEYQQKSRNSPSEVHYEYFKTDLTEKLLPPWQKREHS